MATNLTKLAELVSTLEANKQTVDDAIKEAEERLKMLRAIRNMGGNGKPRTKAKAKESTAAG